MNNLISYLLFIFVLFIGLFAHTGFHFEFTAFAIWFVFSILIAIPFYFEYKKDKPVSDGERQLAKVWIFLRRLVCFTGALGCIVALFITKDDANIIIQATLVFAMLAFSWWGAYGTGQSRNINDDIYYHELRKKRYSKDSKLETKSSE